MTAPRSSGSGSGSGSSGTGRANGHHHSAVNGHAHGGTDEQDGSGSSPGRAAPSREGSAEEEREEEPRLGDAPLAVLELSESCRSFVQRALGVELDYDAETLPILDEYLRRARRDFESRPEAEPLITQAVAAYFGEVVRRRIDGFWRRSPTAPDEWQLCARRAYVSMSPLGMVLESLSESEDHPGPSAELVLAPDDRAVAEARLAAFPEVSSDEYYLLSTRLEVIETVYEALRDRMKAEGRESIVYDEADYDDE